MAHMTPHYENTTKWSLERPNGESERFDELEYAVNEIERDAADIGNDESYTITCEKGWFARLSANGYMDCTDWGGPFSSEEAARDYISDTYDVDPDTGEELEENAAIALEETT